MASSLSIPIISIQVNILESNNQKLLHFSKILDTYEEPEDETGIEEVHDETYWSKKSSWTIDAAKELLFCVSEVFELPSLRYVKYYIAINVAGNNYFSFYKRRTNKSLLEFSISDDYAEKVSQLLDEQSISFVQKQNWFKFTVDKDFVKKHATLLRQIAEFVKETWKK